MKLSGPSRSGPGVSVFGFCPLPPLSRSARRYSAARRACCCASWRPTSSPMALSMASTSYFVFTQYLSSIIMWVLPS